MHSALFIPEIIRRICFLLGPYSPSWRPQREKRDLANLARTSTVFLDAALDVLWECQDGLVNILRCMPVDLLDGPIRRGSLDTLNVTRPITAADWERPLFYLSRVREFSGGRPRDTGRTKLFLDLCSSLPTRNWFPNLRLLEWCCYEPILLPGFFTMLTSSTTKLMVTGVGTGGDAH
ncbi:hypothetical protein MVEN_01287100 [Mycena venus]|uniref:Uncharacterized protein n=1 Tax=Mycena venus TaxID=2733690 RepID=A0A8H6Y0R6_9AGAR|nr:hypothetical protein MVEN_01287100 [Mycena venus]